MGLEELLMMKVGEEIETKDGRWYILRVNGGWLYTRRSGTTVLRPVFVSKN